MLSWAVRKPRLAPQLHITGLQKKTTEKCPGMSLHLLCEKLPGRLGLQMFVQSESAAVAFATCADYVNFLKGEEWRQRIELNLDSSCPLQGPKLLR